MTVAFYFSERCFVDSCGDGAAGAWISRDSQAAMDGAANACEANTTRQGSCSFGGRTFVSCKPGDGPKWAALAVYDDRKETLTDGEAIGYATQSDAEQAAVSNCGQQGCHAVWSQVICKDDSKTNAGPTVSPLNSCLSLVMPRSDFYGDTVSIRNNCPQKVHAMVFPLNENSDSCYDTTCEATSLDIDANSTAPTSKTNYWLRASGGGAKFDACPAGYTPVDPNGQRPTSGSQQFVCSTTKK
jgi:hypothetical protein